MHIRQEAAHSFVRYIGFCMAKIFRSLVHSRPIEDCRKPDLEILHIVGCNGV